jgi:hypothetical protein
MAKRNTMARTMAKRVKREKRWSMAMKMKWIKEKITKMINNNRNRNNK